MLIHSLAEMGRLSHIDERILISSGFKASASAVIPAVTSINAPMKMPRYTVVLKAPKTISCHHSRLTGHRCLEVITAKPRSNMPATRKRMVNSVKGSAESSPNFPATEAEAHSTENRIPARMNREVWDKDRV